MGRDGFGFNYCVAWFIVVCSLLLGTNICKAVDIAIQVGDLGEVDTETATNFMSGITMDKSKWWQLSNGTFHPEAFLRFMVLGAPHEQVLPNSSWGPQETEEVRSKGSLLATRDASVAAFSLQKSIQELGKLSISAWMLAFSCVNSSLCDSSVAPMAIVYREETDCLEFTTVWNKLASGVVTNTLTANLINVTKEEWTIERHIEGESLKLKVARGMEPCVNTSMVAVRTALYAAYNVGPYACYAKNNEGSEDGTGKELLLVVGMQDSSDTTADLPRPQDTYGASNLPESTSPSPQDTWGKCIKEWLQKNKPVDLSQCQARGSLSLLAYVGPSDGQSEGYYLACADSSSKTCLRINAASSQLLPTCDYNNIFTDPIHQLQLINVSGLYYMRGQSSFNLGKDDLCEMGIPVNGAGSNIEEDFDDPNIPAAGVDNETLGMMFTGLKDAYAQAHTDAFQLQNGPSPDFPSTAIALVSAAIAILAATVPFTNFLLGLLIQFLGSLSKYRYWKLGFVLLVNESIIAIMSNSVVIGGVISEKEREYEFKTWALIAEPVLVTSKGLQLQALYVVQGQSMYKSKLLEVVWTVGSFVILLVGGMTLYRCNDVFKKLDKIKEKESSPIPLLDDFKALEMGRAEYNRLLHAPDVDNDSGTAPTSTSPDMAGLDQGPADAVPTQSTHVTFKTLAKTVYALTKNAPKHHQG